MRKPSSSTERQSKAGLQPTHSSVRIGINQPVTSGPGRGLAHNRWIGSLKALTPALYSMPFTKRAASVALSLSLFLALAGGLWWGLRADRAPATPVVLLDGNTRAGAAVAGRVTLVNFWATSCSVCMAEMPQMVQLFNTYRGQGFATVAVAMAYDPPASVIRYSESRQLPFDVVIDNTGSVARAWGGVEATPTSFLVNRQGIIVQRFVGAPDFAELAKSIEKLLKEG